MRSKSTGNGSIASPANPPAPFRARVLLVEDNRVNQTVGALFVKRLGHEVDIVTGGHDAVEAFQRRLYHLILMDCEMPLLDGYEATRAIRRAEERTGGRIPIIAVTANATAGARELCMAAGMDDYIAKPLRNEELAEKFAQWLKLAQAPRCSKPRGE